MFNSTDILVGVWIRRVFAVALVLGFATAVLAADESISTNWTIHTSLKTSSITSEKRITMSGVIDGGGKLIVDHSGGIRFDKSSYDWTGGIELRNSYIDPRITMAFGTGQVLIEPDSDKKPYMELGTYGNTAVFTNDLKQVWDEVADGATEEDFSTYSASVRMGVQTTAKEDITWQGDMTFSGNAVMQVGCSSSYCGDRYQFTINGDVTLPEDKTLYLQTWGNYYFEGENLTAWRIFAGKNWSECYTVHLDVPNLNVRQLLLHSANVKLEEKCSETLPQLHWLWSWDAARYKVDLNGRSFNTTGLSFTERKGALERFFKSGTDSCSYTSGGPSVGNTASDTEAWLTLTGGLAYPSGYSEPIETNYTALVRFVDNVSIRMDAYANYCVQTLRLMPSTTTGAMDVNCGKLRIEAPASFKNLTSIRVGKDGILDTVLTNCPAPFEAYGITTVTNFVPYGEYVENIYKSVTNLEVYGRMNMTDLVEADPLPNLTSLTITPDSRLDLPAGIVLRLKHYIRYNAHTGKLEEQAPGIYHPSEITRGGTLIVDSGDTVDCIWTGTNEIKSIDYGPNWKGYSGNDTPLLRSGLAKPLFAEFGDTAYFSGDATLRGLRLKALSTQTAGQGMHLLKEPGANGRNATISLYDGGLTAEDGSSTTTKNHRNHEIEPPVRVYANQTWSISTSSSVTLRNGFTDDGTENVRVTLATTGKTMSLALCGTNVLSSGSAFVVPKGSTSNGGTLAITGAVHLAGAMVVSNGSVNLTGRLAGRNGAEVKSAPTCGGDGTFTFYQGANSYRFTLDNAVIDSPLWLDPNSGGSLFYLTATGYNLVRSPITVLARTKSTSAVNINTQGGEIDFMDAFVATNCIIKSQTANRKVCRVVFDNLRYAQNGGNRFWIYSPANGITEFNSPGNAFVDPDNGGLTFDSAGTALFGTDLAITNGTLRFNNLAEKYSYASLCDLGSTSQRVDRLVAVRSSSYSNRATLSGDGGWLEIAGNGLSSTNGMIISNCVNIAKTGSSKLLFYDRDFFHTGELNISGGTVEFAESATWMTSSRVGVYGPGCLKLDASERLSPHTQLKLASVMDPFEIVEIGKGTNIYKNGKSTVTNIFSITSNKVSPWTLELPNGVTQTVSSVMLEDVKIVACETNMVDGSNINWVHIAKVLDRKMLNGGYLGGTNDNIQVTWRDDRIQGGGVIKIARHGSIFRFR